MNIAIPVTGDGQVERSFGRAPMMAIATVDEGAITDWQVYDVKWDELHGDGCNGGHHARIVRFLRENDVSHVVIEHMGPPMINTLTKLGIGIHPASSQVATDAVLAAWADTQ